MKLSWQPLKNFILEIPSHFYVKNSCFILFTQKCFFLNFPNGIFCKALITHKPVEDVLNLVQTSLIAKLTFSQDQVNHIRLLTLPTTVHKGLEWNTYYRTFPIPQLCSSRLLTQISLDKYCSHLK